MNITREEFGVDLFEAIKCCGALMAIQDQCNASTWHRKDKDDLLKKRETIKAELIGHMQHLDAGQVGELVQRYPFLATM